jgi:ribonuclease G
MSSELFLSRIDGRLWAALREERSTVEVRVEPPDDLPRAGRILKARVSNVLPGIQSAFLDIGTERGAYLHAGDLVLPTDPSFPSPIQDRLKKGRELLVQVEREGRGSKGARVTCLLTIPGRFLVLLPWGTARAVSRRIRDREDRDRLQSILERLPSEESGWIARTAAAGADAKRLEAEARRLIDQWRELRDGLDEISSPGLVLREPDLLQETLRDSPTVGLERILLDDPGDRERAIEYLLEIDPVAATKVGLYTEKASLFETYGISATIDRALRRRVWLKSGGYLVIEETEALVSIDVNTGKYLGKHDLEPTLLRTNIEAAREIPRQLRLRGLGGIVVVDLIDMSEPESREEVLSIFREGLARDPARTRVVGLSELGLLQLTRKWTRPGLAEQLTRICGTCRGRGRVRPEVYDE